MMYTFKPLTEQFVTGEMQLLKNGKHKFTTADAEFFRFNDGTNGLKASQSFPFEGKAFPVTDFLPFEGKFSYKTRHYLLSIGREDIANSGNINLNDIIGASGEAEVYVGKDKNGVPQSKISDYIKREGENEKIEMPTDMKNSTDGAHINDIEEDDIPF